MLDFDGVLNSCQSAIFWHNKRTLGEFLAHDFCPIALSNMEELVRRVPDLKIVVSSSWRLGRTVEELKNILAPAKLVSDAIIDVTPYFRWKGGDDVARGHEIKHWLDAHPEITDYVIVDDDRDMLKSQQENFVNTSAMHGFQYADMLHALRILKVGGIHG